MSSDASALLRQTLVINAMGPAMSGFGAASGTGAVDVYAQTRAEIQTEKTYRSIARNAMKWVPILNIVLTVVFYALFPILFPLFLLPSSGVAALKGYLTGFFYLAAWGPLFVILHMVMSLKAAADIGATANGGLTLASVSGIADTNNDIGVLAGFLVASVPFLAAGMARGAMAISSQATSYLAPSQNAAEEAGREAATGNISSGNLGLENQTVMTRQFGQASVAPGYMGGAGAQSFRNDDGSVASRYPGASTVDQSGALSNTEYRFGTSKGFQESISAQSESYFDRGSQLSNRASESFSSGTFEVQRAAGLCRVIRQSRQFHGRRQPFGLAERRRSGGPAVRRPAARVRPQRGRQPCACHLGVRQRRPRYWPRYECTRIWPHRLVSGQRWTYGI